MGLLIPFALLAGAATALSPCALPVLPALLSATADGGRRRPLGVVAGLAATFFVTIAGLATVVDGVGLGDGITRSLGIGVLAAFGLALAVPRLRHALEERLAWLSRLGPRRLGDGFGSGLGVGAALGFVYAPCAGPILAGVISVGATQGATGDTLVVAAAYALGTAAVLLAVALGGRQLLGRLGRGARRGALQRAFGVVMCVTAGLMAFEVDVRFQAALADDLPAFVTNPTRALERSDAVERRLRALRGQSRFDSAASPRRGGRAANLPVLGEAPEFADTQRWFNSRPLSIKGLRGRVVLIDFWTYTCINCLRTLPALKALDSRYREAGLTIVGVHTPEFSFERDAGNVAAAIRDNELRYPIVQDNEFGTWSAWGNQYWPAKYLIDARGRVRYTHFGEGAYEETEAAVRALLREAGAARLRASRPVAVETVADPHISPETYLGSRRAEGFAGTPPTDGTHAYPVVPAAELPFGSFALGGNWSVDAESAAAGPGARIDARVRAQKVFLVLSSDGGTARRVRVLVDGRSIGAGRAADDVRGGAVTVRRQRLYRLVSLPSARRFRLTLLPETGVSAFAFTFG